MIISDLQHIEIATETEVQGGRGWLDARYGNPGIVVDIFFSKTQPELYASTKKEIFTIEDKSSDSGFNSLSKYP